MEDTTSFFNYLRMQPAMFDEIMNRVGPRIQKKDTNLRKCLDPGLKLAITIRHLSSGDKYPTLQYDFRVARNTICSIIPEVCRAIVHEYKNELIPCPSSPEEWSPTLDGKHVAIRRPAITGSLYHNYKGFFSLVLIALVDVHQYEFLWIDCGGAGSMSSMSRN